MKLWNPGAGSPARSRVVALLPLVALGLVLLYAGFVVMVWWFQERIVFQPPTAPVSTIGARRANYRTSDGVDLFAYVVGECSPTTTAVLAFHGNADVARWLVPWANNLSHLTGACVVIPEYRGYDGTSGIPSYTASSLDARAALAFLRDTLGVPAERTVFFGHSLGSAIASELTSAETPRALVLQSPFSTIRAMASRIFLPGLSGAFGLISRFHFDTIARVRGLASPVWVSHGDRDIIIPVRMGREVYAAAQHKGQLLIVHGAGHNDVPQLGGQRYWEWLSRAVRGETPPAL